MRDDGRACRQCMHAVTTLHWSEDAWLRRPLQHRSQRSSRLILSLAIRISPSGPCGRHLLVCDLRRFIYLYILYADIGEAAAATAAAADGKCAWIFQRDLRKPWRIVAGLMCCVYTLTAWLFSDADDALRIYAPASHLLGLRTCNAALSTSYRDAALSTASLAPWKRYPPECKRSAFAVN